MPTQRLRSAVLSTVLALLVSGTLVGVGVASASPASAQRYTPPAGVKTNNPLGGVQQRRAVHQHLINTIDGVPKRGQIKIASWNIRSDDVIDALVRAHKVRKVGVRVIIDRLNANRDNPNRGIARLQTELRGNGNKSRRKPQRSYVKKCVSSCRGPSGIAHSKFFLFSRAGKAKWVVINSSANATDLSASHQWNDSYTVKGKRKIFVAFKQVFAQMWQDRNVRQGYRSTRAGNVRAMFHPYRGSGTKRDPVIRVLDKISCKGARNTGGRTKMRIAMTSWHGDRGQKIAWRIRKLQNQGCNIRVVYAVMGNEVLRILRREGPRPVPLRQVVQDFNGDGVYDRYLHTKVLTIKGRYGQDRRANLTVNGSENWTPVALVSDEAILHIRGKGVLKRYNGYIDWLFHNPPRTYGRTASGRTLQGVGGGVGGSGQADGGTVLREHIPLGTLVDGVDPYATFQEH